MSLDCELRREEEMAAVIDVAERFGEMERDRWEGRGEWVVVRQNKPLNL